MAIVGNRVASAVLLLGILVAVELSAPVLLPVLVVIALLLAPTVQWAAVVFFGRRAVEHPDILALRSRVQDAVALALASTVGSVIALLVLLRWLQLIPTVDRGVVLVGLSFALLMVAAPAVNWLITWRPWRSA